jgi:hypothetical protein
VLKTAFQQQLIIQRIFERNLILTIITFINRGRNNGFAFFIKVLKIFNLLTDGLDNGGFGFGSMLGSWWQIV